MKVTLRVVEGPEQGRTFEFTEADSFLVGRSHQAHLRLDPTADRLISRTHCVLDVRPPRVMLTDLDSRNGTRVNGERIRQTEVRDGDLIEVGQTGIRVAVESEGDGPALTPPTPAVFEPPQAGPGGRVIAGRYEILSELGRGGMGVVFRGVDIRSRKVCAVKQLLPQSAANEKSRRLFEREIEIQSQVRHPNLVRVIEHVLDDKGTLYLITEFLPGGDVSKLVTRTFRGPLPPQLACRIIIQVLTGLAHLHEKGLIHRDLKPANYLLSREHDDPKCLVKISDYGFAKCYEAAGNSLFAYTCDGTMAGSPMYMPPEQITNYRFVKPPSDLYAVGVSLYFMLSASYSMSFASPVRGAGKDQGKDQDKDQDKERHPLEVILNDEPVPLLRRKPDLPPLLAAIVDRAVLKDHTRRYQTARELREDLEAFGAAQGWGRGLVEEARL